FFFKLSTAHQHLHSFPTRRSSDLNSASLENINSSLYSSIKILAKLYANELYEVPSITSLGINYIPLPDIAINYQVVNIDKDSVSDRKSTRLNSSHVKISYAVFCLK